MTHYVQHHRLKKARLAAAQRRWAQQDRAYGYRPIKRRKAAQSDAGNAMEVVQVIVLLVIGSACYILWGVAL